ncbi:conjugal transfer protein TraF (plasmid) [Azospirillum oryzae]|uniref:Conjugal transfer protein TraF n=2 Tax=Azospirillaceae TaxID=2829815 RepID=A0A6N1ASF1_9PROT|nr:conjugal transfer protein TraF [Azospirillum oryzae]QCG99224.1 conjugal transfer protein TraF [Azospirillum sp. TSA2s]QKS54681.1 conjugal transfer protein TraF [Azospirillum oryzae]
MASMTTRSAFISTTAALLAGSIAFSASAQQQAQPAGFFGDRERGWFWYEVQPEPDEESLPPKPEPPPPPAAAVPPPPPPPAPPPEQPRTPDPPSFGSAAWLRENLPKYRDRALDEPSAENVRAYYVIQRLAMDKASAFTDMAQRVVVGDPLLDETGRRPTATFAANEMNAVAGEATDAELKEIAEKAGIWFFFRSDCVYCDKQAPVLEMLERAYGFQITAISLDGKPLPGGQFPRFRADSGQAAKVGVERTPTLVLVRPPDGIQTIARGVLSLQELRRRILTGALNAGWIDQKAFDKTRAVDNGPMLPAKLDIPPEIASDPALLVNHLRSMVRQ